MASIAFPADLDQYRIPGLAESFYYIPNFVSSAEASSLLTKLPPNRWVQLTHRRLQAHPSPLTSNSSLLAAPLPSYLVNPIIPRLDALGIFKDQTPHGAPNHCLVNEYRRGEGIMPHEDGPAYAPVVATVSLGGTVVLQGYSRAAGDAVADKEVKLETGILSPWPSNELTPITPSGANSDTMSVPFDPAEAAPKAKEEVVDNGWPTPLFQILLEPGSLFATTQSAYTSLLHGILPVEVDRDLGPDTIANWALLGDKEVYANGTNERSTRVSLTYRDVLKVSNIGNKILGGRRSK